MEAAQVVLMVFGVAVMVALVVWGARAAKKRRAALAAWAAAHGLRFRRDTDRSMEDRHPDFGCLQQGNNRYAYNVISGRLDERQIEAFDYHYETYSTDSKGRTQTHHHHFSVLLASSQLPLKPLHIRAEHFFDKIGEFFGMDDIDFESAEFSRRFHVKSPDRRWAYDVIHQETMEFLLDAPRFTLDMQREGVMAFRGNCFDVEAYQSALDLACGLLERLPESPVKELAEKRDAQRDAQRDARRDEPRGEQAGAAG